MFGYSLGGAGIGVVCIYDLIVIAICGGGCDGEWGYEVECISGSVGLWLSTNVPAKVGWCEVDDES